MTSSHDIITVIKDPRHVLGKQFSFDSDGEIDKNSKVTVSIAEAIQHHVSNVEALENLLAEVSDDSHAAITNSAFPLIPIGVPFLILSEWEFKKRGIKRSENSITWPVSIEYNGKSWLALGRFKEHTSPSSWLLLDRDVDEYTPKHYTELSYDDWLIEVNRLLPGVLGCARLRAHSSSARVSYQGTPVGDGNGHTWIQVEKPDDINRMRSAVKARALAMGMAWSKPRYSRDTSEVIGHGFATIIDLSVFTTGRLVFAGKPEVCDAI